MLFHRNYNWQKYAVYITLSEYKFILMESYFHSPDFISNM